MSYTFSNFNASDEYRGGSVLVTLHGSTATTSTWTFLDPHVDNSYPDVKWDAANANNALYGWELGSGAGSTHTLTYEASTGKMVYFVPSVWYHKFDTTAGRIFTPNTNNYLDASVSYLVDDNELRVYIPLDKPSTVGTDMYYQLRKISGTSFWTRIVHTQGTATNETIVPTTAGIYQLEKVQSSPYISTTYGTAEVSQAQLDFYAANNPPDDDPPDDDPPENDPPPTPVFVPRSARRGNLNFW
jgi:hypothetical protein